MNPVTQDSDQTVCVSQRSLMPWWQVSVLSTMVVFLYYPIFGKLVLQWWNDPNFSHGFIVPLFSFYLLWSMRNSL